MENEVALVAVLHNNKILILRRSERSKWGGGKWGVPGGMIDPGENPLEAAIRELKEETGIEAKLDFFMDLGRLHIFKGESKFSSVTLDHENDDYEWVGKDDYKEYEYADKETMDKIVNRLW